MSRFAGQLNPIINSDVLMRTSEYWGKQIEDKCSWNYSLSLYFPSALDLDIKKCKQPSSSIFRKVLWALHTVNSVLNNDITSILTKQSKFSFVCLAVFAIEIWEQTKKSDTFENFCCGR